MNSQEPSATIVLLIDSRTSLTVKRNLSREEPKIALIRGNENNMCTVYLLTLYHAVFP